MQKKYARFVNKILLILYADKEKYFDKLWLKDSLTEMENL